MAARPTTPITTEAEFDASLVYIAAQSAELARAVLGRDLPVDTVCFFAHSQQEYEFLEKAVRARGPVSKFTHGVTLYVDSDCMAAGHRITILGVRQPDTSRTEIGYGDYPVEDYSGLLQESQANPHAHEISSGTGKSLLELQHPDFDVRGYVVDSKDHK